jgi:hypothetical protein
MVFDEYRHFLPKKHKYRTTKKHIFNWKEETRLKPRRMIPHRRRLEYNINRQGTQYPYVLYV